MSAALLIIALTALGALLLGLRAARGRDMDLEQWTVGGRGFGAIFVFLLMAGEIYTTFTFLGGAGFAYGSRRRRPTTSSATAALAYILSYWLLPPSGATRRRAGWSRRPTSSPPVRLAAARRAGRRVVAVAAMIPYLVLQLKGLGHHRRHRLLRHHPVDRSGLDRRARAVTAYVMASGIHGSAWTAVVKDVLILAIGRVHRPLPADPLLRRLSARCSTASRRPSRASWR